MIKNSYLLVVIILSFGVNAQENLVPNGHFDENTSQYSGGSNPVDYYTADQDCGLGRDRFEDDITGWKVAKSDADNSQLDGFGIRRCSPDWIAGYAYDNFTTCTAPESSFYVSSGLSTESIMIEQKKELEVTEISITSST
jgi:hypothetical protein